MLLELLLKELFSELLFEELPTELLMGRLGLMGLFRDEDGFGGMTGFLIPGRGQPGPKFAVGGLDALKLLGPILCLSLTVEMVGTFTLALLGTPPATLEGS